jgi:sRNA-binding carbon storage regulator CsrA
VPDSDGRSTLTVDVAVGDQLVIGESVVVELLQKSGRNARLRLVAPREVEIRRAPLPASPSMAR